MSEITKEYLEAEKEERDYYEHHIKPPSPESPPSDNLIETPESSNIKSIDWHPYPEVEGADNRDEGNLFVTFRKRNITYEYSDVSREIWEAFKVAPSKGKFCNEKIVRGGYKFERL